MRRFIRRAKFLRFETPWVYLRRTDLVTYARQVSDAPYVGEIRLRVYIERHLDCAVAVFRRFF